MRLGLLTDIHEEVQSLGLALERLRRERVDQVVFLGDLCCTGERLGETVDLLRTADPVGVWGNHDFGLCGEPDDSLRLKYPATVLDFISTLHPRLEVAGCLGTHVEPWLDPTDLASLWWFDGPPDTPEKAARSFDAFPHRVMFCGHFHCWLAVTRSGRTDWDGRVPIVLAPPERYLVCVGAVCNGQCGVFNTETHELLPCDLRGG